MATTGSVLKVRIQAWTQSVPPAGEASTSYPPATAGGTDCVQVCLVIQKTHTLINPSVMITTPTRRYRVTVLTFSKYDVWAAMTEDEFQKLLRWEPKKNARFTFTLGETVRIKTGPFTSFTGRVEGINQAKSLLKVAVTIFGRTDSIKLRFLDVEKVN